MADDRKKYPNSGALFQRQVTGKRPNWSGHIELDGKLLRELVAVYKDTGEAKLDVSGWDREGRNGDWISLSVQRYGAWKERDNRSTSRSRDDRDGRDDRDDRDRDDRGSRSRNRNDEDEDRRASSRGQREDRRREERDLDDDIPF
jgi:hypothetical protein